MTKARDLADLISAGNPLADGSIAASEVTGLNTVATSGAYADLSGTPTLGTAASLDVGTQAWADGADDRAAAANRAKRNQLLADSDWTQMNDSPLANEAKTAWATYRQSLRDITADESWPDVTFPDTP